MYQTLANNAARFAHLFLTVPRGDTISRARLLKTTTRVLSLLVIIWALGGLGVSLLKLAPIDWISNLFLLSMLAATAFFTFFTLARGKTQVAALVFILGFAFSVSIAVWQFGSRVPEVHLGYLIPVALAATLWGSRTGTLAAFTVWVTNILVVAEATGGSPLPNTTVQVFGLLSMGAAYFALAMVVGRYAENLTNALGSAEQKAQEAGEAERQARRYAEDLASSLDAQQARQDELATLYSLARHLAATPKLEDSLPFVTEALVSSLHLTFAAVALIEKTEGDAPPSVALASGYPYELADSQVIIGRKRPLSELPTIRYAIEHREPTFIRLDRALGHQDGEADFVSPAQASGLAILPIVVEDRSLGVVIVGEARPVDQPLLREDELRLASSITDLTAGAIQRSVLFCELEDAYVQTVLALAKAVEAKDSHTADHAEKLADIAERVASKLGLNDPVELQAIRFGAVLHDVGKIGVPDSVLKKPGPLDPGEWGLMKQHPVIGCQIVEAVARLRTAGKIVRHHHERWDGKGYPDGLVGDMIPLAARIVTAVDSYSAMVEARVYKPGRSLAEAVAELDRGAGSQFDGKVVEALVEVLREGDTSGERTAMAASAGLPQLGEALPPAAGPELEVLNRLMAAAKGSLDLDEILREVSVMAVDVFGAAAIGIFLYLPEDDCLELAAEQGLPEFMKQRFSRFPVKGFHNEVVVREGRIVVHGSLSEVPEFVELGIPEMEPDWGTYLCVPLTAKGEVRGVMGVLSHRPRLFGDRDLALYRMIGEQIGMAIANAGLV